LDDFIDADSNDTKIKTLEIKVININIRVQQGQKLHRMQGQRAQNDISNIVLIILVAEVVLLAITMTIYIKVSDKKENINL